MSWLTLPHTVTLEKKINSTRGGPAVDGDEADSSSTISVMVADPLTSAAIEDKYGIPNIDQGYLIIGEADDFEQIAVGDILIYGTKRLQVAARPRIWRPGDGYDSGELIAEDLSRGLTR